MRASELSELIFRRFWLFFQNFLPGRCFPYDEPNLAFTISYCSDASKEQTIYETAVTIVLLLFPTLYGKRGIFTRSPLLWVF